MHFALSADGRLLATTYPTLAVVDLETGKRVEIHTDLGVTAAIWHIAFSPDGHQVAMSHFDGTVSLVDCASGQTLRTMRAPRPIVLLLFRRMAGRWPGASELGW